MTVEQLMKPRYKVIADYPNCDFEIGTIIEMVRFGATWLPLFDEKGEHQQMWGTDIIANKKGQEGIWYEPTFKPFPHLFKPLEWWEDRKVEDMPKYIKSTTWGYVREVIMWYPGAVRFDALHNDERLSYDVATPSHEAKQRFLPATKEEYDQYIK